LGALQISLIKPLLTANGVNLLAIGLEYTGVEEFIERKFFDGGVIIHKAAFYMLTLLQKYTLMKYKKATKI